MANFHSCSYYIVTLLYFISVVRWYAWRG